MYLGNPLLKKSNVKLHFTKEQIEEYIKCSNDPQHFIVNYCYIETLDHGLVKFNLYDCQKKKIDTIHNNRKVIVMEGRQQGKTTTSVAYILWYTLFQGHKNVAILANKSNTARGILSRYQLMYENLPKWMQQGVVNWNKGDIELENGSRVFTAATTAAGIRSQSVNLLYIDEAAIIPNNVADQFFTSVYPVVSAGKTTKIIITSTPLGYNHFWKFWNDAENNRNDFVPLFIPYYEIPGRDEGWLEEQKRQLGELKFNQEVLCKFLGSSATLINADTISKMSIVPSKFHYDGLDIYEEPEKDKIYFMTIDTSKGVGNDSSAFCVFDATETPYKIVAKYKNSTISPLLYPNIIYEVGRKYNNAYCLIEINSSEQVAYILQSELEYENILYCTRDKMGQSISSGFGQSQSKPGVVMDKKVKRIGCQTLKSLVEQGKLLISDSDIISEISTFIERKGSYEADEGYHDDLVMTLVMFAWMSNSRYFKEINNVDMRKAMYEAKIKELEENMLPFGAYNDGMPLQSIVQTDNFTKFLLDLD